MRCLLCGRYIFIIDNQINILIMSTLEEKSYAYGESTVGDSYSKYQADCGYRAGYKECKKEYEEKLRWIPIEESLPNYKGYFSLNLEMKFDNGTTIIGYKLNDNWYYFDDMHVGHLINSQRTVTHWRFL
jgi:hypothetical protein